MKNIAQAISGPLFIFALIAIFCFGLMPESLGRWPTIGAVAIAELSLVFGSPIMGKVPFDIAAGIVILATPLSIIPDSLEFASLLLGSAVVGVDAYDLITHRDDRTEDEPRRKTLGIIGLIAIDLLIVADFFV